MAKKNLIILLFIPFMIAILGVVTINTTFTVIDNDIIGIDWEYKNTEVFKVSDGMYPLSAEGINQKDYPAGPGNNLVWSIRNKDSNDTEVYAEIVEVEGQFFLKPIKDGKVVITCSNEKGNVFKSMTAIIYTKGVVNINRSESGTSQSIEGIIYQGEFDLVNGEKKPSTFKLEIDAYSEDGQSGVELLDISENIKLDLETNTVQVIAPGHAYFTLGLTSDRTIEPTVYEFEVVESGVNVYNYNELLFCTNKSLTGGEVVVLQTSFESLQNMYELDSENKVVMENGIPKQIKQGVQLFGTYNFKNQTFNFDDEMHGFHTNYNSHFIKQWNEQVASKDPSQELSDWINVGLWVQKDFYGNGYTINFHNLAFPTEKSAETDQEGNDLGKYELGLNDTFRGPRPFYSLGNPDNTPMITAYGQDNIGMYLEGNDITLNDIKLKNCDFGKLMTNLEYVGTVVETYGNNITIKNSELSNGKHVVRSFSSKNFTIENSVISNARNFLILVGSNEYISTINMDGTYEFINTKGETVTEKLEDYFGTTLDKGDGELLNYLLGAFTDKEQMRKTLISIQNAFNDKDLVEGRSGGSMNVVDCLFYQSGIASIGIDTMFNGSFLYNGSPSMIQLFLGMLENVQSIAGTNLGGMSIPVQVNISGNTKFYDYKTKDQMDISGLIAENLSKIASGLPIGEDIVKDLNIDKIFPMKTYLYNEAQSQGAAITKDGKKYINVPVAFYGGGLNLSTVNIDTLDTKAQMTGNFQVDLLDSYLNQPGTTYEELMEIVDDFLNGEGTKIGSMVPVIKGVILKCVTVVIGYEPFEFICYKSDDLYGLAPQVEELTQNIEGDKNNENN